MTFVWLDGAVCAQDEARISPADRGFTLGDGLFETMRAVDGQIVNLPRHMARLEAGGKVLDLPLPTADTVRDAAQSLLTVCGLDDAVLRLSVARGQGPRGVLPPTHAHPTVLLTAVPGAFSVSHVKVVTSRLIRRDEQSPLSYIKSLNYLPGILARQEAQRAGAQDALLLNTQGRVAESTISNLLVATQNGVVTPPVADGALAGTARQILLERNLVREATLSPADLHEARGVWLVNSLSLRVVQMLDGHELPEDAPTTSLLERGLRQIE
ncbi:aminotransferase class IV [Acetobacter ghanensis]|uniref:Probable branched-chain-amino-acid aminotransferase n=1 Tax=Acetobacter ghanensis TaxID=431306 RepID=A0A0U5F681_9PROT|nr:aminotransferase class IV [Acetobacter ghanensis]NHO39015.1 aminotransferase [Acetobacter ghanensis]GBQ44440.1 aminotransferase [Acetobacter ghanensis DSM 18895]CEF56999.1 branched-chain amino acid aminotransferase [Acetobacter ghanensis]